MIAPAVLDECSKLRGVVNGWPRLCSCAPFEMKPWGTQTSLAKGLGSRSPIRKPCDVRRLRS
jgi:hypothetical protein